MTTTATTEMIVVDPQGLQLIPWDKVSAYLQAGVGYFFQFFIVVGGSIPYVFQYAEIHHRRNASGFSLFVCLALCVANIARIFFWIGKRFEHALLIQSIVMMATMILMLEIAVRMNRKHTAKPLRKSILKGDFISAFWAWHDLASFLIALSGYTAILGLLTWIFIDNMIYVETIGMLATLTEAMLAVPQLTRNFQRKSTQGMSIPMVLAWLAGDLAKTGYFIVRAAPVQFWICALIQITFDLLILGQVFIYRKNTAQAELPYTANNANTATATTSDSSEGTNYD